ncbi:MAG: hypothetical protein KDG89_16125, partial [Geminicoccaceae bacterium]|nr:hypothetical protein [Geminicoccaceae bacterium]
MQVPPRFFHLARHLPAVAQQRRQRRQARLCLGGVGFVRVEQEGVHRQELDRLQLLLAQVAGREALQPVALDRRRHRPAAQQVGARCGKPAGILGIRHERPA